MTLTYRLWGIVRNRLDEPVFIAVSEPLLTDFDIHCTLESSPLYYVVYVKSFAILSKVYKGHTASMATYCQLTAHCHRPQCECASLFHFYTHLKGFSLMVVALVTSSDFVTGWSKITFHLLFSAEL